MLGYDSVYYPSLYFPKYVWSDTIIKFKAKIIRGEICLILNFIVSGTEYDSFVNMKGAFKGTDNNGETTVIKLLDTDIITIIESNYDEVKSEYDAKSSEDYNEYLEREKIRRKKFYDTKKDSEVEPLEMEDQKKHGFLYRLFHRE